MNIKCNPTCHTGHVCFYRHSSFSFKCPCDSCLIKVMCDEPCIPFLDFKKMMATAIVDLEEKQLNEWIKEMRVQLQKQKDMHITDIL